MPRGEEDARPAPRISIVPAFLWMRGHILTSALAGLVCVWLGCAWLVARFEAGAQGANITGFGEGVWWGIVTLLTVGYGDRYPVTPEGRMVAGFLMAMGVVAMGLVTAKISAYFLEKALLEGRRIVKTESLRGHFVICGWKPEMVQILTHILDSSLGMKASEIILVAKFDPTWLEALREHPRLGKVGVIEGEYFQAMNLRRAAPERARKVLILADSTADAKGQAPSPTEVDARTIMTAMTLANLAPGTLVAAELLDAKMDHYLTLAHVSEIIYTGETSTLLLGYAASGTGLSNILYELLDPRTGAFLSTAEIGDGSLGLRYPEVKSAVESARPGLVVVGILENTGNRARIKEMALRQAQKTPDVAKLVENLKTVKEIRCNHPVFSPEADYVVREGSMAIVIEKRKERDGVASLPAAA